jgi:hypothetical protein
MTGCQHCINCDNLDNKSYCINNLQLSKDEYLEQKEKILKEKAAFENQYLEILEASAKQGYYLASENCS